jgi:Zn-dependent protease with chaperone function
VNESKASRYQRLRRRAQAASLIATGMLLVLLVATGADLWLRDVGAGLAAILLRSRPPPMFVTGVIVVSLLLGLAGLVTVPFRIFRDWVLDWRYGLERAPFKAWLATHVKGVLVGMIMAIGAVAVVHGSAAISPVWWWAIAALAIGGAQLAITTAVPCVLPYFARLRPLDRPPLGARLDRLAQRAGAGSSLAVYEWTDATAVRRAQAALVGLGRTRRVLLSDTLLEAFGDNEIEVIVAHELAHHVHRDLWMAALSRFAMLTLGLGLAHALLTTVAGRYGGPSDPAALPLITLALGSVATIASPLMLALSRRQERDADAFSLDLTHNPDAFIAVMHRMAALNLADDRPSPIVELFFASHPSVSERVAAARAWRPRPAGATSAHP